MRRHLLTEYQTERNVPLSTVERDLLRAVAPSITISPSTGVDSQYDLTPGSWVGAITINPTLALHIRPKLDVRHVLFMLSYAIDPNQWIDTPFDLDEEQSLIEAVIPGFASHVRRAFRRGLLQGYLRVEDAITTVRGRIRFGDQIRKRFAIFPPIEVEYDDFTEDITENRLIKAAIATLGGLTLRSETSRRALRSFGASLQTVSMVDFHPRRVPDVLYTRLNQHYRSAVELARRILSGTTVELAHGGLTATAVLFDMNDVFEDFVIAALREVLNVGDRDFPQGAQGKRFRLDEDKRVPLKPDISWWNGPRCSFIGDVKYKKLRVAGYENADLYQLLAYCTAADLREGLLIYAAGEDTPNDYKVLHTDKSLRVMTLDVSAGPDAILARITSLADVIRQQRASAWRRRDAVAALELTG